VILANQITCLIALLLVLAGCILLHVRLRSYLSLSFLVSIVAIALWAFWGGRALDHMLFVGTANDDAQALIALGRSRTISAAIEAMLMLWFGVSFLLTIRSVRSQHVA